MSKPKRKLNTLTAFLIKVGVIAAIFLIIFTFVLNMYRVGDNNMFPSVRDGDLCLFYRLESCHTSDVVLYIDDTGKKRIGRIVAVEGQEVYFPKEGGYLVNDYQPTEDITYQTYARDGSSVSNPLTVEEDSFFIMNDFRINTEDSRLFGIVKKSQIKGKLIFVLRRRGF